MKTTYDILIIGSGPGGYRAAILAALQNKKVAIIEKDQWGGCCLNRGCVPKKAWHNTAKILQKNSKLAEIGVLGNLSPDFSAAWQHQKKTVQTVQSNYIKYLKQLGVDFFHATAKILNKNEVLTQYIGQNDEILRSTNIIIATGSSPHIPDLFNINSSRTLTTDQLFDSTPLAGEDVAVIGSGVIATEFAFILAMLGKNVHWHSRSPMLSHNHFSEQAKTLLDQAFNELSIKNNTKLPSNVSEANNKITLHFDGGESKQVDWLLLATGRRPNTENLGLENTCITLNTDGFIETNNNSQTAEHSIYAIGDVCSPMMTANQAIADANASINHIIGNQYEPLEKENIPQAIYSALEIAKIGLSEQQAEDKDLEPAVGFSSFESSPAALGQNASEGYVRMIADMDSGDFLGGEIVGENAAELIHILSSNMKSERNLKIFSDLIVNHPSRAEEILNATETLANKWGLGDFVFS